MKIKRSPFYAFRYLVTPISEQLSIVQQLNKSKEELMFDIVENLAKDAKTEWIKRSKRFLFYGSQSKDSIHIIKFAKESNNNIYIEGDDDIEVKGIKNAKYVYLIIDIEHQIILIERNSTVFNSTEYAIKIISEFFREKMREYDYVVNIYPLASKKKFWNYVDAADEIFELSLVLNAPNMAFFGNKDTREVLQMIKETTNNEEFDIAFKNKEGKLKIVKETLGGWVDYVREVGGKYILKFAINGVEDTKTSENDTAKTFIKRKKNELYDDDELGNIKTKLEAIHKLESRDEATEEDK
jgi:hypothetical protein